MCSWAGMPNDGIKIYSKRLQGPFRIARKENHLDTVSEGDVDEEGKYLNYHHGVKMCRQKPCDFKYFNSTAYH